MGLMHKVQVTPVIGLPTFTGWSSVVTTVSGTAAVAMAITGANAHNIGRDIVTFIESTEVVTAADLNNLLLSASTQVRQEGATVSLAAVGIFDTQLFFAALNASVMLRRHTKLGIVIQAEGDVSVKEGAFLPDDVIVLSTHIARELLGEVKQKFQQGFDVDTVVTSIVSSVHHHSATDQVALGFVTFSDQQPIPKHPTSVISVEMTEDSTESYPLGIQVQTEEPLTSISVPMAPTPTPSTYFDRGKWLSLGKGRMSTVVQQAWRKISVVWKKVRHFSWRKNLHIILPLLILCVSIVIGTVWWWGRQQWQLHQVQAQTVPLMAEISTLAAEVLTEPVKNREAIQAKKTQILQLQHDYRQHVVVSRYLTQVIAEIDQILENVSGQESVRELAIFVDLRQLSSDWVGQRLDADATSAALIDMGKNQVATLDLTSKKVALLTLSDPATASAIRDVSLSDQKLTYIGPGVFQAGVSDVANAVRQVITEGDSNREATLVATFGPYVYVVNPTRRNIYRYTFDKDAVSLPIGWVVPGEKIPFDQITSIAVDGEVWLGTRTGDIIRMASGREQDFSIKGLDKPLSTPVIVYTKDFLQHIYILEPGANRVVVIKKNGDFVQEFTSPELGVATDLVANEDQKLVLVVSGSAVFSLSL